MPLKQWLIFEKRRPLEQSLLLGGEQLEVGLGLFGRAGPRCRLGPGSGCCGGPAGRGAGRHHLNPITISFAVKPGEDEGHRLTYSQRCL